MGRIRVACLVAVCIAVVVGTVVGGSLPFAAAAGQTFTVTNTSDSGAGSLRAAIVAANATVASDTIAFDIPPPATTIVPASVLPTIVHPVVIDAQTEPGFAGTPLVQLEGSGGATVGLDITAGGSTVRGLDITNFATGVLVSGAGANLVTGNLVGIDLAGNVAANSTGIAIGGGSTGNTIGGVSVADRNVVSGNSGDGIDIAGNGTASNVVEGNIIGTAANGTSSLANGRGVVVENGASGNTIGGTTPGAGNVVSGNTGDGIAFTDDGTSANVVVGNLIGVDSTGSAPLPNGGAGVSLGGGVDGTTIGGTVAAARNVISGKETGGICICGTATHTVVEGNFVGTDSSGTAAVNANGGTGIVLSGGATVNTIGGTAPGAGNVVSGNPNAGVEITGAGTSSNVVAGNKIGTDVSGMNFVAGQPVGVLISAGASANTIGGTVAASRNVISGNGYGVYLTDSETSANRVRGNYIGTDATGAGPLGNSTGVVDAGGTGNIIGGTTPGARNIISSSLNDGVTVGSDDAAVEGNYIGTDVTGTRPLANGVGIDVDGGSGSVIGGTKKGAGNVVSGNVGDGIMVVGSTTTGLKVEGNLVGSDASGAAALGNGNDGVFISATGNTIGGITAADANVIAFNHAWGVERQDGQPFIIDTVMLRNSIYSNYSGISATATDGAAITAVTATTKKTTITLDAGSISTAATTARVEVFVSPGCDLSGFGQGKTFLGAGSVNIPAGGLATFSLTVPRLAPHQAITATATDLTVNSTSPFSHCAST